MTVYPDFTVNVDKRNSIVRLVVSGELDMLTTPTLIERLVEAESGDASAILLDMRNVTYMDSMGLKALLAASMRAKSPRHFLLVGVQRALRRVFEVTGTTFMLDPADAVTLYTEFTRESAVAPVVSSRKPADAQ